MRDSLPPRVGYVVKRYPRYSETFIVNEILAHEAAGLEIEIFALRPPVDTHFQDIISKVRAPVHYLPAHGISGRHFWATLEEAGDVLPDLWYGLPAARGEDSRDVYQAVALASEAARRGITHLHAHFGTSATTVARIASHLSGLPYSFTAHAKDIFHEGVDPGDLRRKLRDATAVVTVSDYNLAHLQAEYGLTASRVRRIYNGLDLARFPYHAPRERPPRVLAVGRLVEKKGFTYLLDACALLAARGRQFECEIIGAGDQEMALRHKIERLGLDGIVRLVGPRPQAELVDAVTSGAVMVAPCVVGSDGNRDGLPTVLLESMALGTPVISTDVTGIPEILRDGETGLLVPQHDPAALATAIERLLDDSLLRVHLSGAARRLIEREFDIHTTSAALRSLFASSAPVPALLDAVNA